MSRRNTDRRRLPSIAVLLCSSSAEGRENRSSEELEHLLRGLGVRVAARVVVRREPGALAGTRNEELAMQLGELRDRHGSDGVLLAVDEALRSGDQHRLEAAFDVEVIDRTGVVGQLESLAARDAGRRTRRDGLGVALVGYTNAGKSSLMRALTGAEVLVEDRLFATLGSTVRPLAPQGAPPVLVFDTVGFLRRLPTELVASFRSTLAEARDADLLVHVVDASDPAWLEQMRVTRRSLTSVGADQVPELVVLNKVDRLSARERTALSEAMPDALLVSALDREAVRLLHATIVQQLDTELATGELAVPAAEGRLLAEIRGRSRLVAERCEGSTLHLCVRALPGDLARWRAVGETGVRASGSTAGRSA